jgi:hypothetical protein
MDGFGPTIRGTIAVDEPWRPIPFFHPRYGGRNQFGRFRSGSIFVK